MTQPKKSRPGAGGVPVPSAALPGSGVVSPGIRLREADAGGAQPSFSDHDGTIISHVHLYLIFWGNAWNSPGAVPSMGQVTDAVISILTGPYMNSLRQYRGIGSGYLEGAVLVSNAVGSSPSSPPSVFSDTDIETLITNLLSAGQLPDPSTDAQLLYMVVLPPGTSSSGEFIGEHSFYSHNGTNVHYGWVTNGGSLASVTWIFSHELVESVTDPEGTAITGTGCNQSGWCEIGDVCTGNNAVINGITVQRYWSQIDGQCVVPTDPVVKQDKDSKDAKDGKEKDKEKDKDIKDKEKEHIDHKTHKDKDLDGGGGVLGGPKPAESLAELGQIVMVLAQQVSELGRQVRASGAGEPVGAGEGAQPFITADERPVVGERALEEVGVA